MLCEDVRQEASGNFILIGIIGFVNVPQLPVVAFKLCVFNRWTAGIGNFTESVRLIGPDQTTVVRESKVKFALQDPTHNATNVSVFGQVKFEQAGTHYMEVLVDDVLKLRFPIPVRVVTPPQGAPGATAAQQKPPTETR
jgi:hypothetical protein